jgi:methionine--tRNA ligase beta chain
MAEISFDDFQKLDIRIGTVVKAEVPEWSHWVMRLTVDLGPEIGERTIFSGIMKFYKPEDLLDKQFPFIINLKPKRIGPANKEGEYEYSQGMMLMAEGELEVAPDDEETAPVMLHPAKEVPNGVTVR